MSTFLGLCRKEWALENVYRNWQSLNGCAM